MKRPSLWKVRDDGGPLSGAVVVLIGRTATGAHFKVRLTHDWKCWKSGMVVLIEPGGLERKDD